MKILLAITVIAMLICQGCTTVRTTPIHADDVPITVKLEREGAKRAAQMDLNATDGFSEMFRGSGDGALILLPVMLGICICEVTSNLIEGCDVFIYPENYSAAYYQQLRWGSQTVYLPRRFAEKGGLLIVDVKGSYIGTWKCIYDPEHTDIIRIGFRDPAKK